MQFVSCLRRNGVKIPTSKVRGGPVLPVGVKTNTPQYKQATLKCKQVLIGALRKSSPLAARR